MEEKYYHSKESVEEYISLAEGVNGLVHIERFKPYLDHNKSILELGSGPGTDWKIWNSTYCITGSDNSKEFLEHLKQSYPEGRFLQLDAVSIETDEKFDAIYSNKVLHHLSDDELLSSVKAQARVLNDEGLVCHTFWQGEGSEVFKGMFVNYHTEEILQQLFESHFEIISIALYKEFDPDDSIELIARKKKKG